VSAAANSARIEARIGVLERAGRSHLVEYLHWHGDRVGHMREVDFGAPHGKRWRWLVYESGGDCIGDEPTRAAALVTAEQYLAQARPAARPAPFASHRSVGPSSRRPGAGPTEGVVYVQRDQISAAQRAERARDCRAWCTAAGPERERLKAEYERKWCGVETGVDAGAGESR
jgi:hypothetical protein